MVHDGSNLVLLSVSMQPLSTETLSCLNPMIPETVKATTFEDCW